MFDMLVSQISSKFSILKNSGMPITDKLIDEKVDEIYDEYKEIPNFDITEVDARRLKMRIGILFNVSVGESAVTLYNPEVERWFHNKKSKIDWRHWKNYRSMLRSQGRSEEIINANEEVINDILDYSGDPTTPGNWSRKGLVMGNVQSGKTQNYIGLINKAIDSGYKTTYHHEL